MASSRRAAGAAGSRTAAALAEATPADRDRYVDFLRVASLGGVILGHFLMSVVDDRPDVTGGAISFTNILAIEPWTRPATWILQVMPIFFVVGGFAHATSLRSLAGRGGGYADFVRARVSRLVSPALWFVCVGVAVGAAIEGAKWAARGSLDASTLGDAGPVLQIAGQILWFIGIYLIAAGLAPLMLRAHDRWRWRALAALGASVAAVDVLRLAAGVDGVKWLNFALVWLTIHQLGFFYADGVADRVGPRRLGAAMLAGGGVTATVLVWLGPYGTAMVSYPGETLSNLAPPTAVLLCFAVAQSGALLLLRGVARRWLARPRVWAGVIAAGSLAMTAFLWHFSGLILMYLAAHAWFGPLPEPATEAWWWWRVPQLVAFLAIVATLVAAFRWADRPPRREAVVGPSRWRAALSALAVVCAIAGMLGFAVVGFRGVLSSFEAHVAGVPMTSVAALVLVWASWGAARAATSSGAARRSSP